MKPYPNAKLQPHTCPPLWWRPPLALTHLATTFDNRQNRPHLPYRTPGPSPFNNPSPPHRLGPLQKASRNQNLTPTILNSKRKHLRPQRILISLTYRRTLLGDFTRPFFQTHSSSQSSSPGDFDWNQTQKLPQPYSRPFKNIQNKKWQSPFLMWFHRLPFYKKWHFAYVLTNGQWNKI